jgi:NAD(P)-dependent dehydrogenase (short-subunit alcohol dehydrogenase family)
MMEASLIWIIPGTLTVIFILFRLLKFITGDADFTLLGSSLKEGYFKGKVVWVTGASSGIGEGLCMALSKLGAKVILSARSKDKLMSVSRSLAHPDDSQVYVLDVSNRESVSKAPHEVKSLFGRVDILINNAGIALNANFINTSEDAARKVVEVDLLGTSFLTQGVLNEMMLPQGNGHIVNILSVSAKYGSPVRTFYSGAKFGLIGLMDSLRYEMLDKNISITNVCPGPVKTNVDISAVTGEGELFGKRDELIQSGMTVERCAELTLIATSNKLNEVWVAPQPYLLGTYLAQYAPSISRILIKRRYHSIMKILNKNN